MVGTFTDKAGRVWTPRIDTYAMVQLEEHTGVSLFAIAGDEAEMASQLTRATVLMRLLYESVRQEAVRQGVDFETFCRSITGAELRAAAPALNAAIVEAFPPPPEDGGGSEGSDPRADGPGETSTD